MKDDSERLRELPELEVPAPLDELVFARACEAFEREAPIPLPLPNPDMLVYLGGLGSAFLRWLRCCTRRARHITQ